MKQRLIVNADDFGHTSGVSEGIRRAHVQGIVTSTTAMMNRPASLVELPKALARCPELGIGVHLVLTTGKPVLPAAQLPSLVDGAGNFLRREVLIQRLAQINPDEAAAEWHAQVELFIKVTGNKPDHLDSHHHASYFTPALLERMLALAAELGCPIRNPYGSSPASAADYLPGGQPESDFAGVKDLLARFRPKTPGQFISSFYAETASVTHLLELLRQIAAYPTPQIWELMCHPAVVDEGLRRISDYSDLRASELEALTDPRPAALLQELGIELGNFSS